VEISTMAVPDDELASALKQFDVAAECNSTNIVNPVYDDRYHRVYAEFLRSLCESGVKITYGSDCHGPEYPDIREKLSAVLSLAGFNDGDFSEPRLINCRPAE